MKLLSFSVVPGWWARASRSLKAVLGRKHTVTLGRNGDALAVRVGGKSIGTFKVRFTEAIDPERVEDYLHRYRRDPSTTRPEAEIREALHSFLFAGGRLDAPFLQQVDNVAAVHLRMPSTSRLITALPWELTDGPPTIGSVPPLLGTLAAHSLARVLTDISAPAIPSAPDEPRPLSVLLVVNEPETDPFGADQFRRLFARRFHDSRVDFTQARGLQPVTLETLRVQANRVQPHVVVLVAHGRTEPRSPSELLLDSWVPSAEIGAALSDRKPPLLVLLIACDQADSAAAESGALALLSAGVPAVVAMQSSVQAALAAEFLSTVLDGFFQGSGVEEAVAAGRRRMAPDGDAERHTEWSFPALFLQDGAAVGLADLSEYVASHGREYERLIRAITPPPRPYLSRRTLEDALCGHFHRSAGLVVITGGLGAGKTALARYCTRRHAEEVAGSQGEGLRPILYLDLDRVPGGVSDLAGLLSILKEYTAEARIHDVYSLFRWPASRGAGGELRPATVLEALDHNRAVVVLDHAHHLSQDLHTELVEFMPRLRQALVVLVRQPTGAPEVDEHLMDVLAVGPLGQNEAAEFCGQYFSDELFEASGGIPLLLEAAMLRSADGVRGPTHRAAGSGDPAHIASEAMLGLVPPDLEDVLFRLAHFHNGVNATFGTRYVGEWRAVLSLETTGVLVGEERYALGERWLRMPGLLAKHLRETRSFRLREAGADVRDAFDQDVAADPERKLVALAEEPGGIALVHDLEATCIAVEDWPRTRAIPLLLHKTLYASGRWADDARLWHRYLSAAPVGSTDPGDWVLAAKSAHLLGHAEQARGYLEQAQELPLTPFSEAQLLTIQAALLKDSGDRSQASHIHELFQSARAKLDEAANKPGVDSRDAQRERAIIDYNEAIFDRWWRRPPEEAVAAMARARDSYADLSDRWMEAVAASELVDMQIDLAPEERPSMDELIEALFRADETLKALSNPGDRAWLHYRLHRAYRRQDEEDANAKSLEALERATFFAREAGDERIELIARAHAFELRVRNPGLAEPPLDQEAIRFLINRLTKFEGDAWTARVRRDTWVNLALLQETAGGHAAAGEAWAAAWTEATSPLLTPEDGTDARRAQAILCARIRWLNEHGHPVDVDALLALVQDRVRAWFGRDLDAEENLLAHLCSAGAFSGEMTADAP